METTRICLVRHGETAWNAEKRIQGQQDIGLNETGLAQARAAARALSGVTVAALYSSDLLRARQTADCLAETLALASSLRPEFRERRYGLFERLTYEEARALHPAEYRVFEAREAGCVLPGGGESLHQLHARVTQGLRRLVDEHPGQTVVLVTHGGVLDIVNRFVRGRALEAPRDFTIPNAGINWLGVRLGVWSIEHWAATAHLDEVGRDELP